MQPFALCLQLDYYYYYCLECDSSGRTFFLETNHGNNEQGQVKCKNPESSLKLELTFNTTLKAVPKTLADECLLKVKI